MYEVGLMVVYIHVFVPQKHLDYITLRSKHVYFDKTVQTYKAHKSYKNKTFVTQRH